MYKTKRLRITEKLKEDPEVSNRAIGVEFDVKDKVVRKIREDLILQQLNEILLNISDSKIS